MTDLATQAPASVQQARDVATGWLLSPAAWSQFALLILTDILARLIERRAQSARTKALSPGSGIGIIATFRRFCLRFLPLVLLLLAYMLAAGGEGVTRPLFGSGAIIAFGKRVFLFLAARQLVHNLLTDGFLQMLGRFVLVPVAALYALGVLEPALAWLDRTQVSLGNIHFSVLSLLRGAISGAMLFWLGNWSNRQSADYIKRQGELRPATRESAVKAVGVAIFGAAVLLLRQIMGIDLTAVAVLGGALGVGIGLGLQQIAANFVSGLVLLLEGQTTIGDHVVLGGGAAGTITKMTARACVLRTFDGRLIVVPNDHFITTRVTNYSNVASPNRYEAFFSVSYDTDMNRVPGIIEAAVAALPIVPTEPDARSCNRKRFGDSAVNFGVVFWLNGVNGGAKKYMSQVLFAIWRACKAHGVEMPYPHHVVEIKSKTGA